VLFIVLIIPVRGRAQEVSASATNVLRYGLGTEVGLFGETKKEYVENLADVRFFMKNVAIGFRLELSDPPEYGLRFRGVRKKYAEYMNEGLSVRAGDLYVLFNRGTSLSLFENRALAYDSGIEGVRAQYRSRYVNAMIVAGDMEFVEPLTVQWTTPRREHFSIRGVLLEILPLKGFSAGASFVAADGELSNLFSSTPDRTIANLPELFLTGHSSWLDVFASYTWRRLDVNSRSDSAFGSASYISLSHTGDGYGVTLEYKDYRFDIVDPSWADPFRVTRMMAFQNPPTVCKEHSYTSLIRNPHLVDFNDEVGIQFDTFYSIDQGTTLNANFSWSSRHYQYDLDRITFVSLRRDRGSPLFPSFAESRSPFWEFDVEVEHFLDRRRSYLKAGLDRRCDLLFSEFHSSVSRMTTIPVQGQYVIDEQWSVKAAIEQQWMFENKHSTNQHYENLLISLQVSHSPEWSVEIRRDATTSPYDPSQSRVWLTVEGSFRIGSSHTATASYGSERGGQVCTNGICRQVNPFKGLRFSLISQF
jgi:hypothetical protein